MFAHEFMRNALLAGTFVGLACGLVGYFVVLRAQVFAGDALSHVAFTGALGAAALGLDLLGGVFVATICGGLAIGALGDRARADDVAIGSLFAWTLGLGALFLAIFTTQRSGSGNGAAGVRVLFGSIFGLSPHDVRVSVAIAVAACAALLAIARPLLFSSLDEGVAEAQGVPVRALGLLFLALLGVVAAEATQAIGALLLLGLLAAPAGAAQRLTTRPWLGLVGLGRARGRLGLARPDAGLRLPEHSAQLGGDRRRGRRLRGDPAVEQDRPRIDRVDDEVSLAPRVAGHRLADRLLRLGLDHVRGAHLVPERAAEDDEPVVDEGVHEVGVLVEAGLLPELLRVVVLGAGSPQDEQERRHAFLLAEM